MVNIIQRGAVSNVERSKQGVSLLLDFFSLEHQQKRVTGRRGPRVASRPRTSWMGEPEIGPAAVCTRVNSVNCGSLRDVIPPPAAGEELPAARKQLGGSCSSWPF